jgi:inorganic pyrophosphatase
MADLASMPNDLDPGKLSCRAIVETPKGRRNKFRYHRDSGLFELAFLLPEGLIFPFDFGFIPSTLGDDGDPLDVMVLMDEPGHVGCLLAIRLVGAIEAEQTEKGKTEANHRLLAIAANSYSHKDVTSIRQIQSPLVDQLEQFFIAYNKLLGREFKVTGHAGPKEALAMVQKGVQTFHESRKGPAKQAALE